MNAQALIAKTGPWLVALAPAWFVFDVLTARFAVPWAVAGPVAAGVELTGIASYHTFTRLYSYNRKRRKTDPDAPLWLAVLVVGGYIAAGFTLTAVLKHDWSLGLFFVLAAVGYTAIALNIDQDEREREIAQAKAEKKAERRKRTSANVRANAQTDKERSPAIVERSPDADREIERLANAANGSDFGRTDAERWLNVGKTKAAAVVKYGLATEQIEHIGGYRYVCNGANTNA